MEKVAHPSVNSLNNYVDVTVKNSGITCNLRFSSYRSHLTGLFMPTGLKSPIICKYSCSQKLH